jgi:hypothetical protein
MSKSAAARRKRQQQRSGGQQRNDQTSHAAQTSSKSGKPSTSARKVHGTWMTAALIYIGLDGLLSLILLLVFKRDAVTIQAPWLFAGAIAVALATIGSAVVMWYWKRWGLYLLVAATLASIALGIIVLPTAAMVVAFHALIPLGLLTYVLTYQKKLVLLT